MIIDEDNYLAHYGILRKSGRYPWGSGGNEVERSKTFLSILADLRSKGMSDADIARSFSTEDYPFTTRDLREANTIARNRKKAADIAMATRLKEKGYSNVKIGERMGVNESVIRGLLAEGQQEKLDILTNTADMLRGEVDQKTYIDVGRGVPNQLQISKEKLGSALAILKDEGYEIHNVQTDQAGTGSGQKTTVKVLAPPGTTYRDVKANMDKIQQIQQHSDDGGRTFYGLLPPKSLDSSRVAINYADDGGDLADGVMYVRPGPEHLSLGGVNYAQVRVLVDGTHYLKGMAIYKEDLPDGVDIVFNTNKTKAEAPTKQAALKQISEDPDNPFGAVVSQIGKRDERGNLVEVTSVMNLVNKEGDWEGWKKSISSQVLSKQSPKLAKTQLDLAYDRKKQELDEIMSLTNPAVRKKLLRSFSDSADSDAVHLKAAALPRQASHVILPVQSLKSTEIYAPNYNNGERVALIRYPHGGTFEIPELTVNNRHAEAKSLLGNARDAVGINAQVAARLSGADFDGDTVLVIPNNSGSIKTAPALEGLKNFDARTSYPAYEGMPRMTPKAKGQQMGMVSNLITDMTIQGANTTELAAAVRHSMVVIDAEKHHLNYKQSAIDNGIPNLMKKYQPRPDGRYGGASTLISRATARTDVKARKPRPASKGGPIDKATGKKVWEETGESWVDPKTGKTVFRTQRSVKLAETDDAYTLSSGTPIENVYADHSNRMKALANSARKAEVSTPSIKQSQTAKKVYSKEVESLNSKLNVALQNSPRERQAQLVANTILSTKRAANPNMDNAQIKKIQAQALAEARQRVGAKKTPVKISEREWDAIQAGAISNNKLKQILDNTDLKQVKELATPRPQRIMSGAVLQRAKSMAAAGLTQAEIASALGVSVTTVKEGLKSG